MMRLMQAVRFVGGLAMLVGGVAVLVPLAEDVLSHGSVVRDDSGGETVRAVPLSASGHAIPDPRAHATALAEPQPSVLEGDNGVVVPSPRAPMVSAYQPPSPPQPLPAEPNAMTRPTPPLDPTYRSTLAIPPPPLLDAHGPPPLAPGWTTRDTLRAAPSTPSRSGTVPTAYSVRDGDDLTSLAIRFYGHPAAAAAILAANRDRILDPDILPIGATLRLPPPWTITAGRSSTDAHMIEPGAGIDPGPGTASPSLGMPPAGAPSPWLEPTTPSGRS